MGQNTEPRSRHTWKQSTDLWQRSKGNTMQTRLFSTESAGTNGHPQAKKKKDLDTDFTPFIGIQNWSQIQT